MKFARKRIPLSEGGFTLVEMVISIALSAVVLLALGTTLAGGLQALAIAKGRTQGNDVATQAIEDLQRYAFEGLAVCGNPVGVSDPPAGMSDTVVASSSSCPSSAADKATFGDHPCLATPGLTGIPAATYACTRLGRDYRVNRFVAWTDAGRTAKQMAVQVQWTDGVGVHTVSQQSSLRAPVTGDIVGVAAPSFSGAPTVGTNTATISGSPGTLDPATPITLQVVTTGLSDAANDRVFAAFTVVDGAETTRASFLLGSPTPVAGGTRWSATLSDAAGYVYPAGTQYFSFTAVRASDGKSGSTIYPTAISLCPTTGCPPSPQFVSTAQPNGTVEIDSTGGLRSGGIEFEVRTRLLGPEDRVQALVLTRSGLVTIGLSPAASQPCTADADAANPAAPTCRWIGAVTASSGYGFESGSNKRVYFTGVDVNSTLATATQSNSLDFVVTP